MFWDSVGIISLPTIPITNVSLVANDWGECSLSCECHVTGVSVSTPLCQRIFTRSGAGTEWSVKWLFFITKHSTTNLLLCHNENLGSRICMGSVSPTEPFAEA